MGERLPVSRAIALTETSPLIVAFIPDGKLRDRFAAEQVLILGFEKLMRELICVGGDTDSIASVNVAGKFAETITLRMIKL